jgi:hypothetical protein
MLVKSGDRYIVECDACGHPANEGPPGYGPSEAFELARELGWRITRGDSR